MLRALREFARENSVAKDPWNAFLWEALICGAILIVLCALVLLGVVP